jgi:hypothetical protein
MKKSLLVLALALSPIFAHAQSWLQIEADVGQSHYTGSGSGSYYEDGARYPHVLNFTRIGYEAGLTGDITRRRNWGITWHADYVYLGHESFDAQVDSSDANYNVQTSSCNGPCAPNMRMFGGGSVSGIALLLEPYYEYHGVRFGILAGPFIYRPTFSVSFVELDKSVLSYSASTAIRVGGVLGASITYKNVFVRYEYFTDRSQGGMIPGIQTSTHMLSLGYRF